MKKKTWKRCVCMIGVVLFAVTGFEPIIECLIVLLRKQEAILLL